MKLTEMYDKAWKTVICPPKAKHKIFALGPKEQMIEGKTVRRIDLEIKNKSNKILSAFLSFCPEFESSDLVLYLHGNGGSKIEALEFIKAISKNRIAVAAFDFAGCGNSEDQYLTYGINEADDIKDVLNELKKYLKIQKLIVWGRSMGAVSAIVFAQRYSYEVNSLVLDGPFRSLEQIIQNIAYQNTSLPQSIIKVFLYFVKNKVEKQLKLNLFSIDYLEIFKRVHKQLSVLFIYSNYDKIVTTAQVFQFHKAHRGQKEICEIYQGHDEDRKETTIIQGIKWIKRSDGKKDKKRKIQLIPLGNSFVEEIDSNSGFC